MYVCVRECVCVCADIHLRGYICQIFLQKGKAKHSSIRAWSMPWTAGPSGLRSIVSQSQTRVERLSTHAARQTLLKGL